jgi:general secretion pathway protein L
MSWRRKIVEAFSRWIDHVETAILASRESLRSAPLLRLVEGRDGAFTVHATSHKAASDWPNEPICVIDGRLDPVASANWAPIFQRAQVDLVLQPHRFMFRPLELPGRASGFLEGIIRAQIDRLTPWSAADAAFGWRPSSEVENERMIVTIAATARSLITPFVNAFSALGVDAIIVSAPLHDAGSDAASIKVFQQNIRGARDAHRLRGALVALLVTVSALGGAAVAAAVIVGGDLEARRDDLAQRVTERRAALRSARDATGEAALALERRKRETPSSVIVIEALSQILPDHTYLTELHILADKMQIIGVTRDAPSLIQLIEQSSHFTKAVFFAPTTRSLSESGEHFSIEAKIEPVYTASR